MVPNINKFYLEAVVHKINIKTTPIKPDKHSEQVHIRGSPHWF